MQNKNGLVLLFTATIFLSASLLFFVQPLFAKIVLPRLGGSPAVWTTAMLFFQSVLIAGYIYAHLLTKYCAPKLQLAVHAFLWISALFFIPLTIPADWRVDATASVTLQTLSVFAVGVGLPFAFLSANAPLIQSWYGRTDGPAANDPYFLYGASNLGSLGALLAFPLVAEPLFGAKEIGSGWAVGFAVLGLTLAACGVATIKSSKTVNIASETETAPTEKPTLSDYCWWLVLAFIPSSLMLSVTTHASIDLGSFPLLWVVPLALYLLTFVFAFRESEFLNDKLLNRGALLCIAIMPILLNKLGTKKVLDEWLLVPVSFVLFFVIALVAHKQIYKKRPGKKYLTVFYVVMSLGGALGGLFNSLIAPVIFNDFYELNLTLAVSTALLFVGVPKAAARDVKVGMVVVCLLLALILATSLYFGHIVLALGSAAFIAAYLAVIASVRRVPLGASAGIVTVVVISASVSSSVVFQDRSFFGFHQVSSFETSRTYANGSTIHGRQLLEDIDGPRPRPLSYYYNDGSFGQVLTSKAASEFTDIGVIGLGVGALACYAEPQQDWQFYEIDSTVVEIAKNHELFTYLKHCADNAPIHLGDARIVLEEQTDAAFDLLIVDAFSSDAVPVHILTYEALQVFMSRVKQDGVLFIHISNRYFDLSQPIARSASALGLKSMIQHHRTDPESDLASYQDPSIAVIISRSDARLKELNESGNWVVLESDGKSLWTDNYSNVLSALYWFH